MTMLQRQLGTRLSTSALVRFADGPLIRIFPHVASRYHKDKAEYSTRRKDNTEHDLPTYYIWQNVHLLELATGQDRQ